MYEGRAIESSKLNFSCNKKTPLRMQRGQKKWAVQDSNYDVNVAYCNLFWASIKGSRKTDISVFRLPFFVAYSQRSSCKPVLRVASVSSSSSKLSYSRVVLMLLWSTSMDAVSSPTRRRLRLTLAWRKAWARNGEMPRLSQRLTSIWLMPLVRRRLGL